MDKTRQANRRPADSLPASRRPKRCHLCRKNFAPDKYNEHFEACFRVQDKKIEESRTPIINKPTFRRNHNQKTNPYPKAASVRKSNLPQSDRPDTANKFRIKNTSHSNHPHSKPSSVALSHQEKVSPPEKIAQHYQDKKQQREKVREEEKTEQYDRFVQSNFQDGRDSRSEVIGNIPVERQRIDIRLTENPEQILSGPLQSRHQQPVEEPPRVHPQRIQQTVTREVLFVEDPEEEDLTAPESSLNIEAMIANSNSIIEFIRNTQLMGEDETLSTMMAQLQQLNLIAEQILQLNQLGRALACRFRIGNAFALRIHELQTAIINQIGIALMRGFNGRLGFELQILMQRQPELKVGFTSDEIDQIFEQKINCVERECAICLQEMRKSEMVMELQCNHIFHPGCVREWLISSNKCPLCRSVQTDKRH